MRSRRLLRRVVQLYLGLGCYGFACALFVRSGLGLDPWDVLHQGVSNRLGLAIGTVAIAVSAVVLLFWIPLKQWPGLGTVSNAVLVGLSINASLAFLPVHAPLWCAAVNCWGASSCSAWQPGCTSAPVSVRARATA